jgi:hypothetical protein
MYFYLNAKIHLMFCFLSFKSMLGDLWNNNGNGVGLWRRESFGMSLVFVLFFLCVDVHYYKSWFFQLEILTKK